MKGLEKLSFRSVKRASLNAGFIFSLLTYRTVLEPTPETSITSHVFSAILNAYYVPDYKSIMLDIVAE